MSLPSFRGSAAVTNGTTATASPVVNLPASVSAGDTLFVVYRNASAGAVTFPANWNELFDASPDASDDQFTAAWKLADGTEGGTTITLSAANAKFAAVAWCIQNAIDPTITAPAISTVATGTSAGQPNATACTPSGGSNDYLYLTFFGMEGEQTGITSYPTNYTLGQSGLANSGTAAAVTTNVTIAGAGFQKGLATSGSSSDDAGAWTVAGTLDDWSAYTVAFYPKAVPKGTLSYGGLAALTLVAFNLAMPAGTLALTGQTPTVVNAGPGIAIDIPAGQLAIKGPQRVGSQSPSPAAGSLAYTGLAPTVIQGLNVLLPAGSLGYTGLAPSIPTTEAIAIAMPAGSLAYTGLTPSVRVGDVFLDIPAGSLVFKGPQRPEERPDIPKGTLTWTGQPIATITPPGNISIPNGSLVWTGRTPERIAGMTIDMSAGALALTGQYVAVAFKGIDAGSLVWQGLAPTVNITGQLVIPVPKGTLTYTGIAPTLPWSTAIPAGSLVFTGRVPESGQTSSIAIPAGSLVFTGQAPLSNRTIPIDIPAGSLRWTSDNQVVPHIDVFAMMGAGSLAFTGLVNVPVVTVGDTITFISEGQIVFTGYAPTSLPSVELFPGAGSLVYTGYATAVLVGFSPEIPSGSLVWTGQVTGVQILSPRLFPAGSLVWQGRLMRVLNTGAGGGGAGGGTSEYQYLSEYLY